MRVLASWYGGSSGPVLEAAGGLRAFSKERSARACAFPAASILSRPPDKPPDLPCRSPVLLPGRGVPCPIFPFPDPSPDERARDVASRQQRAVAAVAARTGLEVAAVETNAGAVETDFDVHVRQSHGAELAAGAHALVPRLGAVAISSSFDAPKALQPYGSHPVLDSLYSSTALSVSHEGIGYSRLEKIRELAAWEPARHSLMCVSKDRSPAAGSIAGAARSA